MSYRRSFHLQSESPSVTVTAMQFETMLLLVILEQYSILIDDWPSAKEAARFVELVQSAYQELLPNEGFGVSSDAKLYRLLKQVRPDA